RLRQPVLLRSTVAGDLSLLEGRKLRGIERRLHFLVFSFPAYDLLVNPMLAGRFRLAEPDARAPAALGFALDFGKVELRYVDDKQMGKAYLTPSGDWG